MNRCGNGGRTLQAEGARDAKKRKWTWKRHAWNGKSGLGPDRKSDLALTGMAQLIEHCPAKRTFASSIPD